jgi:hypothetical protein
MVRTVKADIKNIKYEGINPIHLVPDRVPLKVLVNTVMNFRVQE